MRTDSSAKIVIMGLSNHPERYAYKAALKLQQHQFGNLIGIHPSGEAVLGVPVVKKPHEVGAPVHTLTMYVGPNKSALMVDEILAMKPQRIIFNPGSECEVLADKARAQGISVEEACTLVLLSVAQF